MSNDSLPGGMFGEEPFIYGIVISTVTIILSLITTIVFIRLCIYHAMNGLKSQFQRLFMICVFNDLICVWSQMFLLSMPIWGILRFYGNFLTGFVPTFGYFLMLLTINTQMLGALIIAINRVISVAMPFKYEKISQRFFWWFVILLLTVPQANSFRIIITGAWFVPMGDTVFILTASASWVDGYVHIIYTCLCVIPTLICNIYTSARLFFHTRFRRESSVDKIARNDIKFHFTSIFMFVTQMLQTILQIIINVFEGQTLGAFAIAIIPFATNSNCLLPLWFLILISEDTRYDQVCIYSQTFMLGMPACGIFHFYNDILTGFVPTFGYYIMLVAINTQMIGSLMIAVNRVLSVSRPLTYEKLSRRYFWLMVVIIVVLAQANSVRVLLKGAKFNALADALFVVSASTSSFEGTMHVIYCFVCIFPTFLCNIYTGIRLFIHVRVMKKTSNSTNRSDMKFHFTSFFMFAMQNIQTVEQVMLNRVAGTEAAAYIAMYIDPWVSNINCLLPLWFLIMISKETSEIVFPCCARTRTNQVFFVESTTDKRSIR